MVNYPVNGGTSEGYLATPASGKGPGAIVIQEWWGLNDQVKGVADMFAREGFVALAPDFYHGKGAKIGEPDQAGKLMMEMQQAGTAAKDGKAAATYLKSRPEVTSAKLGVIGFCMGGLLALLTAGEAPGLIGAVVDCYGVGASKPNYGALRGVPVLAIFGGKDHATSDALPGLERALKDAGASFTKHVYPNADHAFLNEQRKDVYRPDDAKDAWSKIIPFLKSSVR
jgi:carboxymethylenebutenolidase